MAWNDRSFRVVRYFLVMGVISGGLAIRRYSACGSESPVGSDINLEGAAQMYHVHLKEGPLKADEFAATLAEERIYTGRGALSVSVTLANIIGFEEVNGQPEYQESDRLIFTLNLDEENKAIVANDEGNRYFSRSAPQIFAFGHVTVMTAGYHSHYGNRFGVPWDATEVPKKYYGRLIEELGNTSLRAPSAYEIRRYNR